MNINGIKIGEPFVSGNFEKMIESIRQEYNHIKVQNANLRRQLAEWDKDEEIQKANELASYYRRHSLHELSEKEAGRVAEFRKKHYASCHNAGTYRFELTGTGIAEAISVECPVCGTKEDVSDYDVW